MDPFFKYKNILIKYISIRGIFKLRECWNEAHRVYHDISHLKNIFKTLEKTNVHPYEQEVLVLAAFWHDAYCMPGDKENEEKSVDLFLKYLIRKNQNFNDGNYILSEIMINKVKSLIMVTKYRKRPPATDYLERLFWDADNAGFHKTYECHLKVEKQIRDEFCKYSDKEYKKGRVEFLKSCIGLFNGLVDNNMKKLIKYVEKEY